MIALQISLKIGSLYGLGRTMTEFLYGILQGSNLDSFLLKTLKLDWVAFHSLACQLICQGSYRSWKTWKVTEFVISKYLGLENHGI